MRRQNVKLKTAYEKVYAEHENIKVKFAAMKKELIFLKE